MREILAVATGVVFAASPVPTKLRLIALAYAPIAVAFGWIGVHLLRRGRFPTWRGHRRAALPRGARLAYAVMYLGAATLLASAAVLIGLRLP